MCHSCSIFSCFKCIYLRPLLQSLVKIGQNLFVIITIIFVSQTQLYSVRCCTEEHRGAGQVTVLQYQEMGKIFYEETHAKYEKHILNLFAYLFKEKR